MFCGFIVVHNICLMCSIMRVMFSVCWGMRAGTILEKMLFSANHSVGTYHVVIFVVKVANMRWKICNPSWHFNILWTVLMMLHSRNLQHAWRKCQLRAGFKELLVNRIANWWSDVLMICHLAFSTLVYCGGTAREEDGRQEGEERSGRDHLNFFSSLETRAG